MVTAPVATAKRFLVCTKGGGLLVGNGGGTSVIGDGCCTTVFCACLEGSGGGI